MKIEELKSRNFNEWPLIWCKLNAKKIYGIPDSITIMKQIEIEFSKTELLKYWNKIFIPLNKKKKVIISRLVK